MLMGNAQTAQGSVEVSEDQQLGRPPMPAEQHEHAIDVPVTSQDFSESAVEQGTRQEGSQALPSEECVICLNELSHEEEPDDQPTVALVCGHIFHTRCINEWLEKDGRCPVCRHRIREERQVDPRERFDAAFGLRLLAVTGMLILDSRRLMMLAAMEAALAVLVMSYVQDLLSPTLMVLASCVTFMGAAHYGPRLISLARPILLMNALYHVYIMFALMQMHDKHRLFAPQYGTARTAVLSVGCITFMELSILKRCILFLQY